MMKWAVWMALAVLVTPPAPDRSPIAHFVAGRAPAPLTVVSASGKSQVLTDAGWRKLPRQTVKAKDHAGVVATYEGVTVATVL